MSSAICKLRSVFGLKGGGLRPSLSYSEDYGSLDKSHPTKTERRAFWCTSALSGCRSLSATLGFQEIRIATEAITDRPGTISAL